MKTAHWILVTTAGSRERWALENIKRQGHDGYLPVCEDMIRGAKRLVPLFPRYLFVRVIDQWWYLKGTFGVTGIVMDGEVPAVVPIKVIDDIRAAEDNGLVKLPPSASHEFKRGQYVKLLPEDGVYGPFDGYCGIYDGMSGTDRARVLLNIMGRTVPVTARLGSLVTV